MSVQRHTYGLNGQTSFRNQKKCVSLLIQVTSWITWICLFKLLKVWLQKNTLLNVCLAQVSQVVGSDIRKLWNLGFVRRSTETDKSYHSYTKICLSIGFCWQVSYRVVNHRSLYSTEKKTDNCNGKSEFYSACVLPIGTWVYSLLLRSVVFSDSRIYWGRKHQQNLFPKWRWFLALEKVFWPDTSAINGSEGKIYLDIGKCVS